MTTAPTSWKTTINFFGVPPDATRDQIHSRYRFLAKAYHPDRFTDPESKAQAEEEMKRLNEAYDVLSNPDKRKAYDQKSGYGAGQRKDNAGPAGEDENLFEHAGEMVEYFQELEKRWVHILAPFPEDGELDRIRQIFLDGVFALVNRVHFDCAYMVKDQIIKQIDARLIGMYAHNFYLGAEFEKNGFPRQFKPVELYILSSLPVMQLIFQLFEEGQKRGRLIEDEIDEMGDSFATALSVLGQLGQKAGREAARKQPVQRSSQPKPPPVTSKKTEQQSSYQKPASAAHENPAVSSERNAENGFCQACGRMGPTKKVVFHQNIGIVILRLHREIAGYLCADCVEKYFWEMTGKTLLFGWWGVISFIASPFILLINLVNYLGAWELRKNSDQLGSIAFGWKAAVVLVIGVIAYFAFLPAMRNSDPSRPIDPTRPIYPTAAISNQSSGSSQKPVVAKPTPTATKPSCSLWSEVSASDKGRTLCVYGDVNKAYWGGQIYYMSFSDNPNAFRLIVLQGYYFEGVQGHCVMAKGEVKTYGKMPYIEVGENLYKCE